METGIYDCHIRKHVFKSMSLCWKCVPKHKLDQVNKQRGLSRTPFHALYLDVTLHLSQRGITFLITDSDTGIGCLLLKKWFSNQHIVETCVIFTLWYNSQTIWVMAAHFSGNNFADSSQEPVFSFWLTNHLSVGVNKQSKSCKRKHQKQPTWILAWIESQYVTKPLVTLWNHVYRP